MSNFLQFLRIGVKSAKNITQIFIPLTLFTMGGGAVPARFSYVYNFLNKTILPKLWLFPKFIPLFKN